MTLEGILQANQGHCCPDLKPDQVCVTMEAVANLPTRFGDFQVVAFWNDRDGKEDAALVRGNPWDHEDVPVRLHSECLTGDVAGSLRCEGSK